MEGKFQKTENGFMAAASITNVTSKASKGGAVQIKIECPLNPAIAQAAYEYFEKAGVVSFEYNEPQPELPGISDENGEELN